MNENVNFMVESVIQIRRGITINIDASVKIQKKPYSVQKILNLESCYM